MYKKILTLLLLFAPATQAADAIVPRTAVVTEGQNPFISATEIKDIISTAIQNWENNAVEIPELLPDGNYPELSAELTTACQELSGDLAMLGNVAAAYPFPDTNYGYQLENLEHVRQVTLLINSLEAAKYTLSSRLNEVHLDQNDIIIFLKATVNIMGHLWQNETFNQIDNEHNINLININSLYLAEDPEEPIDSELFNEGITATYLDGILSGHFFPSYTGAIRNILHNPMPEPLPAAVIEESDEGTDSEDEDIDMEAPGVEEKEVLEEKASMFQFF